MTRCSPRLLRPLVRDRSAIAAIEFAMLAPVMLIMLLGTLELVNMFRVQIKLNVAAAQLAEMIAGQASVTEASSSGTGGSLADMCTAASYNLLPYNRTPVSALVGSVTVNASLSPTLDWFTDKVCPTPISGNASSLTTVVTAADKPVSLFSLNGTPVSGGSTAVKGYSAISVEMTYVYTDIAPFLLAPKITLTSVASARPRSNVTIPCSYPSGTTPASCGQVY